MTSQAAAMQRSCVLVVEAVAAGLAYGAGLCWASVCLLGSFRPRDLSSPYWPGVPYLRSDTSGIAAFVVLAICLCVSEYLRLRRRAAVRARVTRTDAATVAGTDPRWRWGVFMLAVSETVALLSTALVGYLSVNAITHPGTLQLHLTHLLPWPAEGTVRVMALLLSGASIAIVRYLWAVTMWPPRYAASDSPFLPRTDA